MITTELISIKELDFSPAAARPLLISPAQDGVDLQQWAGENIAFIEEKLLQHGAIYFRGFNTKTQQSYEDVAEVIMPQRFNYMYQSTPRTTVGDRVYTATEYPAKYKIPLHMECAYTRVWPMKLMLFCDIPAETGGSTPLCCTRGLTQRIPQEIFEEYARKGVKYVRNYQEGIDVPWQDVFQTESKSTVEEYCRKNGLTYEWIDEDWLRTSQVAQGAAIHPQTKDLIWYNQSHLFHYTNMAPEVQEALLSIYEEDELPRNSYFGDGSPIPTETLEIIRAAYDQEEFQIPWQQGDIALIDNMLCHHGRTPFSGKRRILVTMGGTFQGPAYPLGALWS
ncbi:MAG: TauD/TfdA family dioxygenase [Lentisphaeraceae bacterium]|nr:TauD/TfdA family dioxygenase [Lentisphaeraceae bacterium]